MPATTAMRLAPRRSPSAAVLPAVAAALVALPTLARAQGTPADVHWDARFGYLPGYVFVEVTPDRAVFFGPWSCLDAAGAVVSCNFADWDGTGWRLHGPGDFALGGSGGLVHTMAVGGGGVVFVGGRFDRVGDTQVSNVAAWTGTEWQAMGEGLNSDVNTLYVNELGLWAGGSFTQTGAVTANRVARYTGTTWVPLVDVNAGNGVNGTVRVIRGRGGNILIAGALTGAGGVTGLNGIVEWFPSSQSWGWSGPGPSTTVYDLNTTGGGLYARNQHSASILRFDGDAWNPLPLPDFSLVGPHFHVATSGLIYALGSFNLPGGPGPEELAVWDGTTWSGVGAGVTGANTRPMAGRVDDVYAPILTLADGRQLHGIGWWSGSEWHTVGQGLGTSSSFDNVNHVLALARTPGGLFAAGTFRWAADRPATGLARWTGTRWEPVGGPAVPDDVRALLPDGSGVIAGGAFTTIGGVTVNGIARWDGAAWHPLGGGVSGGRVNALARDGADLYVGGSFFSASGQTVSRVARWDGAAWHPLGQGIAGSGTVEAMVMHEGRLVVAGRFSLLGDGTPVRNVAAWDGAAWAALGTNLGTSGFETVTSLAVRGGQLYAGLRPVEGSGEPGRLYRWTGATWEEVAQFTQGGGLAEVSALYANGGDLYVGGTFTEVNGARMWRVAKWDGSAWSGLGSGLWEGFYGGGYAASFAGSPEGLWIGGQFQRAGNTPSGNVALWHDFTLVPTAGEPGTAGTAAALSAATPHPVRRTATLTLTVPRVERVRVAVYDALGREVALLHDGPALEVQLLTLDAAALPAGVYVVRATGATSAAARRVVVAR